ncbi:hypothetical protein HYW87_02245, partial [Candidatus Roizmanbacteria bacterium]|nr:hypothetical protein [Candidatus Roizmanbacteria bacterium]
MHLPFFSKKSQLTGYYFGLFLKEEEGIGFIIHRQDGQFKIVQSEKFSYTNGWGTIVEDVDQVLLKLEERNRLHIKETIIFVYSHFIDQKTKNIQKQILNKIKELVKELDLKALGYIECHEAVADFLEKKEEMPLTGLLIELDRQHLTLFVYKHGRIEFSKVSTNTDNLIDDLLTIFEEVKGKFLLPSRMILYNSKDLDAQSTKIVTFRWSEDLFVQLPRVEIIKEEEILQSMVSVFAEQMKSKALEDAPKETVKEEVFGFMIGKDIQELKEKEEPTIEESRETAAPAKISQAFDLFSNFLRIMNARLKAAPRRLSIILGIAFILLGILVNEYFFHKAQMTLF